MHGSPGKKRLTQACTEHSAFSCTDTWDVFFFFSFFPHLAPTIIAFLSKEWLNADLKINFRTDALIPFVLKNARALCNPSQACCGPPPGKEVTLQLLETTVASISLLINMGSANNTHNQWKRCLFFFPQMHSPRTLEYTPVPQCLPGGFPPLREISHFMHYNHIRLVLNSRVEFSRFFFFWCTWTTVYTPDLRQYIMYCVTQPVLLLWWRHNKSDVYEHYILAVI